MCLKMAVFWAVATCGLVEVYQRFRGPDNGGRKDLLNVLRTHSRENLKSRLFALLHCSSS
jgi:hypothetical protein